ncbi:MAG: hypothetical protein ACK4Z0_06520 [Sphingomonadaceae bacterium]
MRALLGITAGLSLVAGPVVAQSPEMEQDAERYARDERYDQLDPLPPQRQPWTLALWLPANLRANRRFAERGWKAGVALDPGVDLVLTADVQRNRSNFEGRSFTNVIVGPALSARVGF